MFTPGSARSGHLKRAGQVNHTLDEARVHLANGGNIGLLGGLGPVALDVDERFEQFVLHDERLRYASIVFRDNALPGRGKVMVVCRDPQNLKSRKLKADPRVKDAPPVAEILSGGAQAIVAVIHAPGATIKLWRRETVMMTAVEIDELVDAWMDAQYPDWRTSQPLRARAIISSARRICLVSVFVAFDIAKCTSYFCAGP